jgi:integrase
MTSHDGWWRARGKAYVNWKRQQDEVGEEWLHRVLWDIGRTPTLLNGVGFSPSPSPRRVSVEHIRALKAKLGWEPNTLATFFAALRPFLQWIGNPVADHGGVWRLQSGGPTHRRWLTDKQLVALYRGAIELASGAQDSDELGSSTFSHLAPALVACEGFNALRRIEIQRLRVKDLDFASGRMRVHGKGRNGGKWREIPMTKITHIALEPVVQGKAPSELVFPGTKTGQPLSGGSLDKLIHLSALRAGLPRNSRGRALVSNHDLRRTFGRIAYYAGMSLVDLKNFYGHTSIDMTAHYIGMDEDRMRDGLTKFDAKMASLSQGSALTIAQRGECLPNEHAEEGTEPKEC